MHRDLVVERLDLDAVRSFDVGEQFEMLVQEGGNAVALQRVKGRGVRWRIDLGGQLVFHVRSLSSRRIGATSGPHASSSS